MQIHVSRVLLCCGETSRAICSYTSLSLIVTMYTTCNKTNAIFQLQLMLYSHIISIATYICICLCYVTDLRDTFSLFCGWKLVFHLLQSITVITNIKNSDSIIIFMEYLYQAQQLINYHWAATDQAVTAVYWHTVKGKLGSKPFNATRSV